jgi:hypothetical protein
MKKSQDGASGADCWRGVTACQPLWSVRSGAAGGSERADGAGETLYRDTKTSNRYAAARARMAVSLLMQAAQKMMREQQYAERMRAEDKAHG